jgi:hypothetical protein
MWESAVMWTGLVLVVVGLPLLVRPVAGLGVPTRGRALVVAVAGAALALIGLVLPASDSRVATADLYAAAPPSQLDLFAPVWQFREVHERRIAAPPARVYDAIRHVRADEIALFNLLTWIRRGGQPLPKGILNPGEDVALLDAAVRGGFVWLADQAPRELVVGAVVIAPAGTPSLRGTLTPERYRQAWPDGFALATMNFLVRADDAGGSVVTTETRVWASSADARRRFAAYWRVIYPGSALIRRMWLRAIAARAAPQPR